MALIHDKLSEVLVNDPYFDKYTGLEKTIRIHDHIVRNQIYGVAIGNNSYMVTKERVCNCENNNSLKRKGTKECKAPTPGDTKICDGDWVAE